MSYEEWMGVALLFVAFLFFSRALDKSIKLSEKQFVLMKDLLEQTKTTKEYVIEIEKNLRGEEYWMEREEEEPQKIKGKGKKKIK